MTIDRSVPLRERQAELTREAILSSVADLLREEKVEDITVPAVAERSGISLRTVYRYYPDRDRLLEAAAEWINENAFGGIPDADDPELLVDVIRTAFEKFEAEPGLVRAMALSEPGRSIRRHRRRRRLAGLSRAIEQVAGNLPVEERRQAEAVIGYLHNMLAWVTMREESGLDASEAGDAISWATEVLLADLKRRDAAVDFGREETR